jgi:hypothetical protein
VTCRGFSGHNQNIYFWNYELKAFSKQLKELEENRQGSVTLAAMGGEAGDFQLNIFSTDKLGNMAVEANLRRVNYVADGYQPLTVSVAFEIDPVTLVEFAREFKALILEL